MTASELASRVNATILRPDAVAADVHRAATHAMQLGLRGVVAGPVWTSRLAKMIASAGPRVVSVVGYPFGSSKSTIKAIEATSTIKDGADEIEVTPHLPYLISGDLDGARAELMEIVRAARATRRDVVIHVAIDAGILLRLPSDRQSKAFELAARAARESGADGIVASGQAVEAIEKLKPYAEALTLTANIGDAASLAGPAIAAGAYFLSNSDPTALVQQQFEPIPAPEPAR